MARPSPNAVPGCTTPILTQTPHPTNTGPFYPGFVVGDPSSARYLFRSGPTLIPRAYGDRTLEYPLLEGRVLSDAPQYRCRRYQRCYTHVLWRGGTNSTPDIELFVMFSMRVPLHRSGNFEGAASFRQSAFARC